LLRKVYWLCSFFIINLAGILITYNQGKGLYLYFLLAGLVLITILFVLELVNKKKFQIDVSLAILFTLFTVSNLISVIVNAESALILSAVQYYVIYLVLVVFVSNIANVYTLKYLTISILFSHIYFLIYSIVKEPNIILPYKGIFDNPNTFGIVLATLFTVSYSLFLYSLRKIEKLIYAFLSIISLVFILYSGSRTSFLCSTIIIFLSLIIAYIRWIIDKKYHIRFKALFKSIIIFLVGIVVFRLFIYDLFINTIYNKFLIKYHSGDVLDYRTYIWQTTIKEGKLFGHGSSYFVDRFQLGSHNTFISILGQFGWISLTLFILIICSIFIQTLKYSILTYKYNRYADIPFLLCCTFLLLSMTEIMLMKSIMLSMFISIAIAIRGHKNSDAYEKVN
jgi:hypothetical protein